jgi:hypothetical protein
MSTPKELFSAALALEQTDVGNFDALVAAFEKCHRADPSNEKMKEKYLSYFKKIFDRQHSKNENADELKQLGNKHLLQQQYDEAIIFYDAAINVDPMAKESAPIYSNRSLASLNLNNFKDAFDDAQMAISVNPEFARGYLREAMSAMKLEKYQESLKSFRKYLEMDQEARQDKEVVANMNSVKRVVEQRINAKNEKEKEMKRIALKARGSVQGLAEFRRHFHKAAAALDSEMVRFAVENDWDLSPFLFQNKQNSGLEMLLARRAATGASVPASVLAEFDETILWVIEKMKKENVEFLGQEIVTACTIQDFKILPNPRIVESLLATKQMKINEPAFEATNVLQSLAECAGQTCKTRALPSQISSCFQMLLLQPDIDVNLVTTIHGEESSAISGSCHPEITQILLRAGANPNQILKASFGRVGNVRHTALKNSGRAGNVLHRALQFSWAPFYSENIRVLIESGARLLPNKEGSSDVVFAMVSGNELPSLAPEERSWVSPAVFDMVIQLAKHQKLDLVLRKPGEDVPRPLLYVAMSNSAPIWLLQKILAIDPQVIHSSMKMENIEMPVFFYVTEQMEQPKNHPYASVLLQFLLENGADLKSCILIYGEKAKAFQMLRERLEDFPALKSKFVEIIIKKHGEQYFNKLEEEYTKMSKQNKRIFY